MIQFVLKYNKYTEGDFLQYTGYKNIPDFYDRVRALLSADSVSLSDEIIDFPENAPLAEKMIKRRVVDWEVLPEEKEGVFESAVVCQTAIVMYGVTSANEYKVAQTQSLKVEYAERSTNTIDFLKGRLDSLIGVLNEGKEVKMFPMLDISG